MYKQNITFVKLSISKAFVSDYAVGTKREYKKVAEQKFSENIRFLKIPENF